MRDVMTPVPRTIHHAASLADARGVMARLRCRRLPVTEHGAPVGVVTDGDLDAFAGMAVTCPEYDRVTRAMTRDVYATTVDANARAVARVMRAEGYHYTVVLDGLRIVGLFAAADLRQHLVMSLA